MREAGERIKKSCKWSEDPEDELHVPDIKLPRRKGVTHPTDHVHRLVYGSFK